MMELAFLGKGLQMVQGMAGTAASAHQSHVLFSGEGHGEVDFDESQDVVHSS